jgi:restriction system protein
MRSYYRVMLGKGSTLAAECFAGGFIGTDFLLREDLTHKLTDEWRAFNKAFIPVIQKLHPKKNRIGAGLACGAIWTVSKGIAQGDYVLCADGTGNYHIGEVVSDYHYVENGILPHRRKVRWLDRLIPRAAMSDALRNSAGSRGTVGSITPYAAEIEALLGGALPVTEPAVIATDPDIEDPAAFAMEKHLEEFLTNWNQTILSKDYSIYEEDGEIVGQQYATDAGPIDVLAVSKDGKRLLVVELKRGRASDVVVGQVLRYMGFVKEQLAEPNQTVEGIIIALEDDKKLRWALAAVPSVSFYRYEVSFKLVKA